ncbi:MAG: hypothetical protein R3C11_20985 [Planctomycetaceae bacterium]
MSKTFIAFCAVTLLSVMTSNLSAQTELYLALSSPERVVNDITGILDLTSAEEQQQKEVLNDYFSLLLDGVESKLILKLDVLSEPDEARYRIFFPVTSKTRDFRDNLKGYEFYSRRDRTDASLYSIEGEYTGFLKFELPYAILSRDKEDFASIITQPADAFSKHPAIAENSEIDVILNLENKGGKVDERHANFGGIQKIIKAYVTREEGESAEDFAVRESVADQLISELERIYAEASSMLTTWSLLPVVNGTFTTNVEPITETSLAATVNELKTHPSQFAGIPEQNESVLKVRILLPLDELRQKNLTNFTSVLKTSFDKKIGDNAERSDEAKAAYTEASGQFFEMLNQTIKSGWLDTVAQVYNNEQGRVSLAVVNSVNGNEARKILELIPKTSPGRTVEFDVDKQGEVAIHKVSLEEGALQTLQGFFGDEVVLYVGTTEKAFWIAAGANAIDELKSAITQAEAAPAQPAESNRFIDLKLAVGSWVETVHKARGESGNEKTYNFAKTAFSEGNDAVTLQLNQNGDLIDGQLLIEQGVLRFAGKLIADFSAENLQE